MTAEQLAAQAAGLRQTAETMIKAGTKGAVEVATRNTVAALIQAAKQLKPGNPIVASLQMTPALDWSEVLTIANVIYTA